MSDQPFFPGFEGDDEEAKAKSPPKPAPGKPTSPMKPAAPVKPATGATQKPTMAQAGDPPQMAQAESPKYEFEESEPAAEKTPYTKQEKEKTPVTLQPVSAGSRAKAPRSAPQPAPSEDPVDPELKPGSRKDLWTCPHCGTGNKPGRPTCRKCEKSPDDAIEPPWFKKPAILGGIVGGVALLIAIIALWPGTDLSAKPPSAAQIDSKPRLGGTKAAERDVDSKHFTPRKRISVCGRCIGARAFDEVAGGQNVVLMLGKSARPDDAASAETVTFEGQIIEVKGPGSFVVLHLLPNQPGAKVEPTVGKVVSVTGDVGDLEGFSPSSGAMVVLVDSFTQE